MQLMQIIIFMFSVFLIIESINICAGLYKAVTLVDKTEVEAARSMGFSELETFFALKFPQAIKRVLPGYIDGFIELIKSAVIVGIYCWSIL